MPSAQPFAATEVEQRGDEDRCDVGAGGERAQEAHRVPVAGRGDAVIGQRGGVPGADEAAAVAGPPGEGAEGHRPVLRRARRGRPAGWATACGHGGAGTAPASGGQVAMAGMRPSRVSISTWSKYSRMLVIRPSASV